MARSASPRAKAGRALLGLLAIVVVLLGLNVLGVALAPGKTLADKATSLVPKLGLDLEGGTQIILRPVTDSGNAPTADQLAQVWLNQAQLSSAALARIEAGRIRATLAVAEASDAAAIDRAEAGFTAAVNARRGHEEGRPE